MPAYDFRCRACSRGFTLHYAQIADIETARPVCPACGAGNPVRLIRRVNILTSEDTRAERLADPSWLSGLDDDNPRALGRFMRETASQMGEDMGPEFSEIAERLESGQSPEEIEASVPLPGADSMADSFID